MKGCPASDSWLGRDDHARRWRQRKETGEAGEMWPHVARIRARAGGANAAASQARLDHPTRVDAITGQVLRRAAIAGAVLALAACKDGGSAPAPAPSSSAPAASASAAKPSSPEHMLLVVSIDGLRHDWAAKAEAPTLKKLAKEGASARAVKTVWPSVTYPAHTTLMTGVSPHKHGIVNNVAFDPMEKNDKGWYWYAVDIKSKTLWDAAAAKGMDVGNVYWPVTVGAKMRWNIPQIWRAKTDDDDKLMAALATPGTLPDKSPPAEHRSDRERADAAIAMIREKKPGLMLVYMTDLDTVQHETGPFSPPALKTLAQIDGYVGEILAAAKAVAPRVTLALVSDHGFAAVDKDLRPNALLRRKKLFTLSAKNKPDSWKAITWKAGGSAAIFVKDPKDEATKKTVREIFAPLPKEPGSGIAEVYEGEAIEKAGGWTGAFLVIEARPGYLFSENYDEPPVVPSTYRGHHGYSPERADMKTTFFLWGDGVLAGADLGDVDIVDVAPTLAKILGVGLEGAEGKALEGALQAR
jgi:predicted AlkP superfamily pyrophosphatase or phosphodiesterase